MGTKRTWAIAGVVLVTLGVGAALAAFAVRWSAPCDEELADAEAAWRRYASHVEGTAAADEARAVADALPDLPAAIEASEGVLIAPPPGDAEGTRLYRAANEALSLADGACRR